LLAVGRYGSQTREAANSETCWLELVIRSLSRDIGVAGGYYTDKSYLSALYAFEPAPPYRIVARSGSFCFGYPDEEEAKENYYAKLTHARNLIMGEPENCPFITFVSGITEKVGNPSKVIIGYGINDCISRFVEVDKSELVRLLFHPTGRFAGTAPLYKASTSGF
jgi:hypothetical protein